MQWNEMEWPEEMNNSNGMETSTTTTIYQTMALSLSANVFVLGILNLVFFQINGQRKNWPPPSDQVYF